MADASSSRPVPEFDEAMRLHEREIMRFLARMAGDREDALDLFQETWVRAYRAYPSLDSGDGLRPWLFRIAANLCRNRVRDRIRRSRVIAENGTAVYDRIRNSHPGSGSPDGVIDLRRAIHALPGKQGQAFIMRKVVGMEYGEIGAALGCSEISARASVYQALKKLRKAAE